MAQEINVVVLGGCGFLGQHVVAALLNEKEKIIDNLEGDKTRHWVIKDIKVLDVKPLAKGSLTGQRKDSSQVTYRICDIVNFEDLKGHLKGASAVINCAAVIPDLLKEDLGCGDKMQQVNVEGTRNIIRACKDVGVQALIHTSSVSVIMGGKRLIEHTETLSPDVSEDELILGDYARGRLKAEKMVLEAHGTISENGVKLNTVALRPPLMYGEGDTYFVPLIYSLAKAYGNKIPSIGNPSAPIQAAYAGNIAVAHVCALNHLLTCEGKPNIQICPGLPVYVTDDTPPTNLTDQASQFLTHTNLEPCQKDSYYYTSLNLYMTGAMNRIKSVVGLGSENQTPNQLTWVLHQSAGTITVVSRMRAELCLDYSPIYNWEEAQSRAGGYYRSCLT